MKGLRAFIARYGIYLDFCISDSFLTCSESCQTYEGGFSASSQPYFSGSPPLLDNLLASPRPALGEAHGGYTFCALASLVLLEPLDPYPNPAKWMGIDVKRLYRWASSMQGTEVDGGGFRGRTNKLVDGCYSWWVGGLFPLLEDIMGVNHKHRQHHHEEINLPDAVDDWADEEPGLFNRRKLFIHQSSMSNVSLLLVSTILEALQGFILVSSQAEGGGLRDKPGRSPDAYHTLYNLSGLSSAQHHVYRTSEVRDKLATEWVTIARSVDLAISNEDAEIRKAVYLSSIAWVEEEGASRYVGGRPNRVVRNPTLNFPFSV